MNLPVLMCLLATGAVAAEKSEFQKHLDRVFDFKCGQPQSRSFPVSSLKTLPPHETYFPAMTVLHRCDECTGTCTQGEGYGCRPAATEEVTLVFQVMGGNMYRTRRGKSPARYATVTATNHTLCECQQLVDLPK